MKSRLWAAALAAYAGTTCWVPAATYSWGFTNGNLSADLGPGTMSYAGATAGSTTFGTTDGVTVPHIAGQPATYMSFPAWPTPAANDTTLGYLLEFSATGANGGGSYVNQFTLVFDVFVPGSINWTPIFQTNTGNPGGNDADFYVASDGALGIGELGYSPAGTIAANTWYRIGFAADLGAGDARFFVNGTKVVDRDGGSLLDGRFSLTSNLDAGPDLLLANENDASGNYTHATIYSDIAFVDRALSDAEMASLGGPSAAGIFPIPEPMTAAFTALGGMVFLRRRRPRAAVRDV